MCESSLSLPDLHPPCKPCCFPVWFKLQIETNLAYR